MGSCGLYLGKNQVGSLAWKHREHRLALEARCPCELGWIYRVVLQTGKGMHPLGVMVPEEDSFILRRELLLEESPHCGFIDRTLPGEVHLPGLPLAFSAFALDQDGLLHGHWMDTEYLLLPLQPEEACAVPHLLCLMTPTEHQGKVYGAFCRRAGEYLPLSDSLRKPNMLC